MRNYFFVVMAFFVGTVVRADVVFENTNTTGASVNNTSFSLNFTVASSGASLSSFVLFGEAGQSSSLRFNLDGLGLSSAISSSRIGNAYTFSLSSVTGVGNISAGPHQLSITNSGFLYYTTTTSTISNAAGFSETSYSNTTPFSQFQVNGAAVPEPGTMLLGGIAAAVGGAGAWWKRRKQRRDAAAFAAGDGA